MKPLLKTFYVDFVNVPGIINASERKPNLDKDTRSLARNLSLWSVEKTQVAYAKADVMKQEWDIKVYNFL